MANENALITLRAALLRDPDQEPVHLYPMFGKGHITRDWPKRKCWCEPEPDHLDPRIIIHKSSH